MMRRVLLVALLALAVSVPTWTAAAHADSHSAALMEAVASDEFVDAELVAFVDVDSAADSAADVSVMVDTTDSAAVEAEVAQTPAKAKAAKAKKPAKAAKAPKAAKAAKLAASKATKSTKTAKAPKAAKAAKTSKAAKATTTATKATKTNKTTKTTKNTKTTKATKTAKAAKTTAKATKTASKTATPAKAAKKTTKAAKPAKATVTKAKTTTKAKATKTTKTAAKTATKTKAKSATSSATAAAAKKLKATASKAAAKESAAQRQSAEALEADMSEEGMRAKFANFKAKRKKPYFSAATEAQAYRTFKKNRLRIHEMNKQFGKKGQKLFHSAGPFADIEPEEFKKKFRTIRPRTGAAPEPTAVPAKTVVRKGSSKSPASKLKARKQSLLQLETETEMDEHALSMMEVGFGTATEAEVGNACTTGARGPKGVLMQGGSVRKCAMEQGWPAAAFDPSRPHGWSWCCVPAKPAEVEAKCAARGVCMPNTAGTAADGCAAVGGVFDTKHSGYCPENSGGPATAEGNRCCVKDGSLKPTPAPAPKPTPTPSPAAPASGLVYEVDYRFSTGKTTPVKHQGQCGSCWAHAAIQGLESALLFAGKSSPLLSAQAIMDCRPWKAGGGESCVGGWYEDAFKHWQKNRAVTQEQYPYLAKEQKCAAPAGAGALVKSWGYATPKCSGACPKQDEEQLLVSLKNYGPLSIYLDAASFQHYKGGILPASSCSSNTKDMDHAVQIVGYGTDEGKKFWLLRNSWGEKWGEAGYVRAEFGTNTCGLANTAAFITV